MNILSLISESFSDFIEIFEVAGRVFPHLWFIILPVAFYYFFKMIWMDFVNGKFLSGVEYVLLEIIPPRDIEKSPQPMESFFDGLAGTRTGFSTFDIYIHGKLTLSFTMEIVSNAGEVHFYVRTPKNFQALVEANLYAQYPEVEVIRVPDYVNDVPKVVPNKEWDLWGADLELVKPDAFPIRSWRNFKEDVSGEMIDPLSSLVEGLGKVGPNQNVWIQIIATPEEEAWHKTGKETVEELAGRLKKKSGGVLKRVGQDFADVFKGVSQGAFGPVEFESHEEESKEEAPLQQRLTPGEMEVLQAVERSIGKNVFSIKMRFICLGRRENFDRSAISAVMGAFKQFSDQNLNGIKPNDLSKTYANYLFSDQRLRYRQSPSFLLFFYPTNQP